MQQYLDLVHRILDRGVLKGDRTGTGTYSIFSHKLEFDLRQGFPLITTKFVPLRLIAEEIFWFLRGETNATSLIEKNVHIWDDWSLPDNVYRQDPMANYERLYWLKDNKPELVAEWEASGLAKGDDDAGHKWLDDHGVPRTKTVLTHEKGEVNAPYGPAWRQWESADGYDYDQIAYVMDLLRNRPDSRRILVSAWNPGNMPDESISPQQNVLNGKPALTPCHWAFEFYTEKMSLRDRLAWVKDNDGDLWEDYMGDVDCTEEQRSEWLTLYGVPERWLDLKWHQRSVDTALGLPFNIASYALLQMMVAQQVNMVPRMLEGDLTNVHVYSNHVEGLREQLTRDPLQLPTVTFKRKPDSLEDYVWEDIQLHGYKHHPKIEFDIAV